ncbi:hypothetical protein GGI20_001633 [Coemansia sp. BCRC 34301]|nr:hypothetical protein GGI20_001633 [Coemansia sp. BCRC 34301]
MAVDAAASNVDGRYMMSLTPTSSVAVLGLATMRYGQVAEQIHEQQRPPMEGFYSHGNNSPHGAMYNAGSAASTYGRVLNNVVVAQYPVGRYLSSLDLRRSAHAQAAGGPPLGSASMEIPVPALVPIATTSTTPAVFVSSRQPGK